MMNPVIKLVIAFCILDVVSSNVGQVTTQLKIVQHEIVYGKIEAGDWDDKLMCTHGIRVSGFRLRVAPGGLGAIQLSCADGTRTYKSEGIDGDWMDFKYCDGVVTQWASKFVVGFKFRSSTDAPYSGQNVALLCNEGTKLDGRMVGYGTPKGTWDSKDYTKCPESTYFCGVQRRGTKYAMNQLRFLCCRPNKEIFITESVIMGKTDFGHWTKMIMCANSGQISGFRLQVEDAMGAGGDDTGLNGIQLLCKDGTATEKIEGPFGKWKSWQFCDTKTDNAFFQYVTGFNMRSEKKQYLGDDSGANNVMFQCRNKRKLDGQGTSFGTWDNKGYRECPYQSFLCGVQAKMEQNQYGGDDTAINQLKFICCKVEPEKCPIQVEPLGCFKDKRHDRTMPIEILNERDPNNNNFKGDHFIDWWNFPVYLTGFRCRCALEAARRGYKTFGIQFYAECWSGPATHIDYDKHGDSGSCIDTKYKKIIHPLNTCPVQTGVANSNFVYRIESEDASCDVSFAPVGCFEDFMDVPRPVANYEHNERDDTIPGFNGIYIDWKNWNDYYKKMICRCARAAKKNNHEIFSIQYWGECWTQARNETEYDRNGPSTRCRGKDFKPCPCNSFYCVGMHQANYVYTLKSF